MSKSKTLTQERLQEVLHYDADTGVFTWNLSRGGAKKGSIAGCTKHGDSGKSYFRISISGKTYLAHRLAFLYMEGKFPENQVDHISGNGLDNRWENLRLVTNLENSKNQRKASNNTSGHTGISWHKQRNKWRAFINVKGEQKNLGYFNDKNEAIRVRKEAEIKYSYHENHGTEREL